MPHQQKRPGNQETKIYRKQGSFAMDCIDHRSGWSLHRDPDQPTESQHITHTAGIPSTRSKIGSQEWTETGLHVGEKESSAIRALAHSAVFLVPYCSQNFLSSFLRARRPPIPPAGIATNFRKLLFPKRATSVRFPPAYIMEPWRQQYLRRRAQEKRTFCRWRSSSARQHGGDRVLEGTERLQ